jgi:hypothetical protein
VFNAFTVLEMDRIENRRTFWISMCECGRIKSVRSDHLQSSNTKSCNECDRVQVDITGHIYGKLTVLKFLRKDPSKGHQTLWLCRCECGTETEKLLGPLRTGMVLSCGCEWHKEGKENSLWKGKGVISSVYWRNLVKNANQRKLEVVVTLEYIATLFEAQDGKCALTSLELIAPSLRSTKPSTASLDRIDSSQGYVPGNVQWVHKDVNKMKNNIPQDRFIELCSLVARKGEVS